MVASKTCYNKERVLLNILCGQTKGFNVCHINARSIRPKLSEFQDMFKVGNVHAILFCETWLRQEILSNCIKISGYCVVRNDRAERTGGGVAIYIKESFKYKIIANSNPGDILEYLGIEVCAGNDKVVLFAVYCPPKCFNLDRVDDLKMCLLNLQYSHRNILIGGDWNVNLLKPSAERNDLLNFLQSVDLTLINNMPTYFNAEIPSQLDLLLCSDDRLVAFSNQISAPSYLDHDILFTSIDISTSCSNDDYVFQYRDFRNLSLESLTSDCSNLPWHYIYDCADVNQQTSIFNDLLLQLFDKHVPIKYFKKQKEGCPWFTSKIETLINVREYLYRKYRRHRSEENRKAFKVIRNKVNFLIRQAKRSFHLKKLDINLTSKQLWSNLRQLGIYGKDKNTCCLDANDLNAFFCNSPSDIHSGHISDVVTPLHPILSELSFSFS